MERLTKLYLTRLALLVALAIPVAPTLMGCGGVAVGDVGPGGPGDPDPDPTNDPNDPDNPDDPDDPDTPGNPLADLADRSLFDTNVAPILNRGNCGCHSGGSGGYAFYQGTGNPDLQRANWINTACRLTNYDPVESPRFVDRWCADENTPNPNNARGGQAFRDVGEHGVNISSADCQNMYEWARTGEGVAPPSSNICGPIGSFTE